MQPVSWFGTGMGRAMIIHGKLPLVTCHGLGGEFGYMTTIEPQQKTQQLNCNSASQEYGSFMSLKIWFSLTACRMDERFTRGCNRKHPLPEAIGAWILIPAQRLLNNNLLIDPDVVSLGGSISQNEFLSKGVQKRRRFVERYEEYTIAPVIQPALIPGSADLYGATCWLQGENNGKILGLSPKQVKYRSIKKSHFSTGCRGGSQLSRPSFYLSKGENGRINWPTASLINSTATASVLATALAERDR